MDRPDLADPPRSDYKTPAELTTSIGSVRERHPRLFTIFRGERPERESE